MAELTKMQQQRIPAGSTLEDIFPEGAPPEAEPVYYEAFDKSPNETPFWDNPFHR